MKPLIGLLVLVMLLIFATGANAGHSSSYTLTPEVLASGGQATSSANYSFVSMLGQPLVGSSGSAAYSMCNGFWCEITAGYRVYLPAMLKES